MTIRAKLLVGCLSLTLVMIALGGFALLSQRQVGTLAGRIYDEALLSLSYLRSAQNSLVQLESDYSNFVAARTVRRHAFGNGNQFGDFETQFPDILADLQVAAKRAISPAGKEKTGEITRQLTTLRDTGSTLDATEILGRLEEIDRQFDVAVEIFAGDGYRFRREVGDLIDASLRKSLLAIIGGVAIAFLISIILSRIIVPPLNKAVAVAMQIAAGKLDNRIEPRGRGETADLLRALSTMQDSISSQLRRIQALMAAQAHRYDNQIAVQNTRFEAALNNMSQGLCMFDQQHKLVVFNRRFAQMFGGLRLGASAPDVLIDADIQHLLSPGNDTFFTHELPDGRVIAVSRQSIEGGGWVDTFEDITERRRAELELNRMAMHDALTGLANRVQFRDRLEATLTRPGGRDATAVLCLDLDGFKSVNDTLGHPVGDLLLKAVASRLQGCLDDTSLVARLGGDEFAIILSGPEPDTASEALARTIIETLGQPFELDGHHVTIGVSIGVVLAGQSNSADNDADKLIKNADLALYRAKDEGRSTYRFFQAEMDERVQARRRMELDLRSAIERQELEVFYQPFVDVEHNRVSGFEALLRWRHPERGLVSPAEFIPLAEECGLIKPIGAWVLDTACAHASAWPEHLKVSVNLSPVQFKNSGLIEEVRTTLAASGLDPARLQLEVTESLLLQETEDVLAILQAFRAMGIQISMDDFGTGYSSLGYISRFPFDKIKIDQSFVRNIENADDLAIIRAVIGLSGALDIAVIAEGVETREQLEALMQEGCREMQGYYFSKPKPVTDLAGIMLEIGTRTIGWSEAEHGTTGRLGAARRAAAKGEAPVVPLPLPAANRA